MARQMKDSGIEWIGEIPECWERTKLLNLLRQSICDGPHETPNLVDEGIPFISIDSLNTSEHIDFTKCKKFISEDDYLRYYEKANIEEGDVLFTKAATIGKTAIVGKERFMVWSPIAIIKANEQIAYNKYVYHLLNCFELIKYISMLGSYNTQINVGMRELEQAVVPFPYLAEQQRIAAFLDRKCAEIDAVIERTKATIEEYKKLKQAVITEAVTKGVRGARKMKDSGIEWIGEIPESWQLIRLKFLMDEIIDCPHETPVYTNEGAYFVIRTADQDVGYLRSDDSMYRLDEAEYIKRIRRLPLEKDDIVYGREGERWGLACIISESDKYCLGQRMMQFRCNGDIFFPEFARWALNSNGVYMQGTVDTIGSTSPHVNISTMRNYAIPIPPVDEQKQIAKYVTDRCDKLLELISRKEAFIAELESYKKSLIYEYVTGKKEV